MEPLLRRRSGVVAHRPPRPLGHLSEMNRPFSGGIGVSGEFGGVSAVAGGVSGYFGRRVGVPRGLLCCGGVCFGLSGRAKADSRRAAPQWDSMLSPDKPQVSFAPSFPALGTLMTASFCCSRLTVWLKGLWKVWCHRFI